MPIVEAENKHWFEYRHVVCFEETNVVGNVYYANHVRWQGRCREMFLKEYSPDVVDRISTGLALITLRVSCEYFSQLRAFDELAIRLRVNWIRQNRMGMLFDYWRTSGKPELIARGEQDTAAMQLENGKLVVTPFPESMLKAIERHRLLSE